MGIINIHNPNSANYALATSGTRVNDGATILRGGNIDSTNTVTNAPNWLTPGGQYGSRIPATDTTPARTHQPLVTGKFAYVMQTGAFLVRTMQVTLAGQTVSGIILNRGSDFGRRSIHASSGNRRLDISDWSYITGSATTGSNAGQREEYGVDHETTVGYSVIPGEFVYQEGDNVGTQDEYNQRTG